MINVGLAKFFCLTLGVGFLLWLMYALVIYVGFPLPVVSFVIVATTLPAVWEQLKERL